MRKHNEQTLKSAINEFLGTGPIKKPYIQSTIKRAWKKMMGPVIDNYTDGIFYSDGKLTIKISSASLRQDLWTNREKIKTQLNEILESELIEKISIR
jgi:hypothetical protein